MRLCHVIRVYPESFSALLELLDNQRFARSTPPDRKQLNAVNAVAAAYGWTDLDLGHGFHETKQGVRYTISEAARREVLSRLLKLNHERYAEEVNQGLFMLVFEVTGQLAPDLQVIITDHGDLNEPWLQQAVVARWRDGEKLVPESWIESPLTTPPTSDATNEGE